MARLKNQQQLKDFKERMRIAQVLGMIREDRVNEAVDTAIKYGYTAEQFGIIAQYTESKDDISKVTTAILKKFRK